MSHAVLSLGSNVSDRLSMVAEGIEALAAFLTIEAASGVYESEPIGPDKSRLYANCVLKVSTNLDCGALNLRLKQLEIKFGRDEKARMRHDVPLDIDIVAFDGEILRPRDYSAAYFRQGLDLIAHII